MASLQSYCRQLACVLVAASTIAVSHSSPAVQLTDLTTLNMAPFDSDFQHITIPSTGQLLTRIGPSVWQGNADIYPIDPRITSPGDSRRAGHYWSQFLMAGTDPADGQYFLTDRVESEGQQLQSFDVIQNSGKVIEYEGTWTFRDLFTTTAHHWVWVEGSDQYHRVQATLDVLKPISDVKAIWTEWFNVTDAYKTLTVSTRDDGIVTRNILGTTNQHYLYQYELGRDNWMALSDPQIGQADSVARVLLSSTSDIRIDDEVTPVWADASLFDNIELHIHNQQAGTNLAPGTSFFMDNLVITNPTTSSTNWVESRIDRAKEWITLIGPPIAPPPAINPGSPVSRYFIAPGGSGSWSNSANWMPSQVPDLNDAAIINSGRTATIDSNVGSIGTLRLGDSGVGTLNVQPGASLTVSNQVLIGASSGANKGVVHQTGGNLTVTGSDPVIFVAFDSDDMATYEISGGEIHAGNLWFRFGKGTFSQTGGKVAVSQLVLGEGGVAASLATYTISGGALSISGAANIGKAPGVGDPFANSHGTMHIDGGVVVCADLLFGGDATDSVNLSQTGVLRVLQANYSVTEAMTDIASARIQGSQLFVATVSVAGVPYTQVTPFLFRQGDFNIDGVVDGKDLLVWQRTFGSRDDLRADGDGNLVVDQSDLTVWKSHYGAGVQPAVAAVPEPTSLPILLMWAARLRRRPRCKNHV